MSDGAGMGISADRALKTILGGEDQPSEEEVQSKDEVRERLINATADTYEGATDCIARAYLRILEADPETQMLPLEAPHAFVFRDTGETLGYTDGGTRIVKNGTFIKTDWKDEPEYVNVDTADCLWDRLKKAQKNPDEERAIDGCTGFMMGFAFNQARWVLDLPPAPNPAIIEIG